MLPPSGAGSLLPAKPVDSALRDPRASGERRRQPAAAGRTPTVYKSVPCFYIKNFGCRATQADGAAIAQQLAMRGLAPAADARAADLVVLNTCTVTASAEEDARQAIRRVHRENPGCRILVTGCYAQRAPQEVASLPGVGWVVGNSHKGEIGEIVAAGHNFVPLSSLAQARIIIGDIFAHTELEAAPVFGPGVERTRPTLKIQDGCNNRCSFCIIPSVRGLSRSLRPLAVIAQVRELERAGYREVVLSGINLGRYGRDLKPRLTLAEVLRAILNQTAVERIRLSSVEPMDFTDELLELMAGSRRFARHVHAPLQSGSDRVLRLMRRRYRAADYQRRLGLAHQCLPNAAFGADVMVGFPGETGEDFEQTRALVARLPFTYLHVFTYSRREGTAAAGMPEAVDGRTARERNRILRELAAAKNLEFRRRQLGCSLSVITLHDGSALSDNYLKVRLAGPPLEPNRIVDARITAVEDDRLVGEVPPGGRRVNLPGSPGPGPAFGCV